MMRPGGFLQRCLAWSLDAAVLVPATLATAWPWLRPAAAEWRAAADTLYGSMGQRVAEAMLDGTPPARLAGLLVHDPALRSAILDLQDATWPPLVIGAGAFAVLGAAWNVAGECSPWRGSAGKRLVGLQVLDRSGARIGIGRSLLRHVAGAASWATLNLGHAAAALPPDHRALHDRIAGTRVVTTMVDTRLPPWAWAWLAAVMAALAWATAWLAQMAGLAMEAGIERAFQ